MGANKAVSAVVAEEKNGEYKHVFLFPFTSCVSVYEKLILLIYDGLDTFLSVGFAA